MQEIKWQTNKILLYGNIENWSLETKLCAAKVLLSTDNLIHVREWMHTINPSYIAQESSGIRQWTINEWERENIPSVDEIIGGTVSTLQIVKII